MNSRTQLENVVSFNTKNEKIKALKALEIAKQIKRTVVVLPKGYSRDYQKLKLEKEKRKY